MVSSELAHDFPDTIRTVTRNFLRPSRRGTTTITLL
jgi:hypothetical protein